VQGGGVIVGLMTCPQDGVPARNAINPAVTNVRRFIVLASIVSKAAKDAYDRAAGAFGFVGGESRSACQEIRR
jgi:hypothetical protein